MNVYEPGWQVEALVAQPTHRGPYRRPDIALGPCPTLNRLNPGLTGPGPKSLDGLTAG